MQGEVLLELRQAEEPLQRGLFHLVHVAEAHVVLDERNDLRGLFEREAQPPQNLFGDANADLDVAVEANPVRRAAKGRGLANIVQQRTPGECRRRVGRELFEQQQGVNPDIALGVKLRGLLDAVHLRDLRQHLLQQPSRIKELKGAAGVAFGEHAGKFVADPLAADLIDLAGKRADGRRSALFNRESESRGEADGRAACAACLLRSAAADRRWPGRFRL